MPIRLTSLLLAVLLIGATRGAADPVAEAVSLFEAGHYPDAQARLEAALASAPDDARLHHYLGKIARRRQDSAAALAHLERAVTLAPTDAAIQYDYGVVCSLHAESLGRSFRAIAFARRGRGALERAVALAPAETAYRQALIEFYQSAPALVGGGPAKAHAQARALQTLDPVAGGIALANLDAHAGEPAAALARLRALRDTHPDNPAVLYQLGRHAAAHGSPADAAEAIAALERCLALPAAARPVPTARLEALLAQLRRAAPVR